MDVNKSIIITKDLGQMDIPMIYKFLTSSYWAEGRTMQQVVTSMQNSTCYGIFKEDRQIGFARIISDKIVFAYLMDVFILENERENGYARQLLQYILDDHEFRQVQQWYLKTKDAHALYERFGFRTMADPKLMMEKISTFVLP